MTEIIFAVLFVSLMGLTRCYKTTVFLHLYVVITDISWSNLLSTDDRCLVIILGGQCNMVDFTWSSVARFIAVSRYTCTNFMMNKPMLNAGNHVFKNSDDENEVGDIPGNLLGRSHVPVNVLNEPVFDRRNWGRRCPSSLAIIVVYPCNALGLCIVSLEIIKRKFKKLSKSKTKNLSVITLHHSWIVIIFFISLLILVMCCS